VAVVAGEDGRDACVEKLSASSPSPGAVFALVAVCDDLGTDLIVDQRRVVRGGCGLGRECLGEAAV
jgi:hypothetical protein